MKKIIHRASDRGIQDHGWLKAAHSFSFAQYHDPSKVNFGLLRVLNDDIVAPGMGFGTHGLPDDSIALLSPATANAAALPRIHQLPPTKVSLHWQLAHRPFPRH
jgi:hypothetical protein